MTFSPHHALEHMRQVAHKAQRDAQRERDHRLKRVEYANVSINIKMIRSDWSTDEFGNRTRTVQAE